jgi:integrase
MGSLFRRGNI